MKIITFFKMSKLISNNVFDERASGKPSGAPTQHMLFEKYRYFEESDVRARLGGACTVQGRRDCRLENPPAFIQRSEHEGTSVPELADATLPLEASQGFLEIRRVGIGRVGCRDQSFWAGFVCLALCLIHFLHVSS
jgi:hypothetical protein